MCTRDKSIDIAKGLGIVFVVWGHLNFMPLKNIIYIYHIPLFFILSGFCVNLDMPFLYFIKKKINAYVIPYFVYFFYILILFIILYSLLNKINDIYIIPSIIIKPYGVVGGLWFLISLSVVQILYYIINMKIKSNILKTCVCLFSFFVGYLLYRYNIHILFYFDSSLSMLVFFNLGVMLKTYSLDVILNYYKIFIILFCLLFFYIGIINHIDIDVKCNKMHCDSFLGLLCISCASFSWIILSYYINKYLGTSYISKMLSFLGRNTFPIFALHLLCIEFFLRLVIDPLQMQMNYIEGSFIILFVILFSFFIGIPVTKILKLKYLHLMLNNKNK